MYCRNHTSYENFKLKLCMYKVTAWNSGHKCDFWHYIFAQIILESSRNAGETPLTVWRHQARSCFETCKKGFETMSGRNIYLGCMVTIFIYSMSIQSKLVAILWSSGIWGPVEGNMGCFVHKCSKQNRICQAVMDTINFIYELNCCASKISSYKYLPR